MTETTRAGEPGVEKARRRIAGARRIVALTGAGISTDSGIPDFRGPKGVWTRNPGAERRANIQVYVSDPQARRDAWQQRLQSEMFGAKPNAGHLALVELERQGKLHTLVTQNVDGLHRKAGHSPERVVEIHGTVLEAVCLSCNWRGPMSQTLDRVRAGEADPACLHCGGILKSATISFGQALVPEDLARAERAAAEADLLLAVGSTLSVYPAAGLVPIAVRQGAALVIVNAEPTTYDDLAEVVLRGSISEVLPGIVRPMQAG